MTMRSTVVHIIVDDGAFVLGIVEEGRHLRTNHGVHGVIRAEHHDVIGLDIGIDKLQLVMRMIFIEDVFRIVILIEERQ